MDGFELFGAPLRVSAARAGGKRGRALWDDADAGGDGSAGGDRARDGGGDK